MERSTNIPVTESTTLKPAKMQQILSLAMESVSCVVPTETATGRIDYINFHLQKWCQSDILLVTIEKLSK